MGESLIKINLILDGHISNLPVIYIQTHLDKIV